jgi:ubiquinone/menaquinone biosynthesis C-methylase UbiE
MTDTPATVGEFFSARAHRYDDQARLGLLGYDAMLDELTRSLPDGPSQILELGCGTGALTSRVAQRFPGASIHAIDASGEMLMIAEERIRAEVSPVDADRVSFEVACFEEARLGVEVFDLVTASMSLHHLVDKLPFYREIRKSLRRGGNFVFADELTGVVPYIEALHWNDWLEFASRPGHLSRAELAEMLRHCEEFDHYETLPAQLELIADAGFGSVDCIWRASNYAIFAAQV